LLSLFTDVAIYKRIHIVFFDVAFFAIDARISQITGTRNTGAIIP